jgi:hypothetical protein
MKLGRNTLCPCGSGRKYKQCCQDKFPGGTNRLELAKINRLNLRWRYFLLFEAVEDIFGFKRGAQWRDVQRRISGDHIKELYKVVSQIWPQDTDLKSLGSLGLAVEAPRCRVAHRVEIVQNPALTRT